MSEIQTITLGIVSGIFTTVVLYLIGKLFTKVILPWYQDVIYKGVDVKGSWIAEIEQDEGWKAKMELNIRQNAHLLKGDTTIIQGRNLDNPTEVTNMSMNGEVWEGYMTLNMQSKDRSRLSYQTSLLQVLNGGQTLKGYIAYRSIRADEIRCIQVRWRRKE